MNTLKKGLKKASENMKNAYFVSDEGAWGGDLDWIAGQGQGVKVYDCPEGYRPDCEDDYPAEAWLVAKVDPDGDVWPLDGKKAVLEAQGFLWDAFTDAGGVGVKLDDLLTWPGLGLAKKQVKSVEAHYDQPEKWTKEDEEVRDLVADATDCEDFETLYSWLSWTVGDQTAAKMVEEWEED